VPDTSGAAYTPRMDATMRTADGLRLVLREWPVPAPQGTVLLVHGLGEHIGRYLHVAERLNACGWTVAGYDQRGHGASDGPRGRIADAHALLDDLGRVATHVQHAHTGPHVLLGHSLGGLVAARFAAEAVGDGEPASWYRPLDGLVLSSPAVDIGMTLPQRLLLALLGPIAPQLAVRSGLDPRAISRDPRVVAAYRADPLVHDRIAPRLARFMLDAGDLVRARAPRWHLPTLLLYAGADRLVVPAGSAAFAAAAPKGVVTVHAYPELYHEVFNEPEQAHVFDDLRAWLATRASRHGGPSAGTADLHSTTPSPEAST